MTGASRALPGDRPCIPYVGRTNPHAIWEPLNILLPSSLMLSRALSPLIPLPAVSNPSL